MLFGRDSLKIRHPRAKSITVHLQSFVEDLLAQVIGTSSKGREERQVYIHFLELCGVVLTFSEASLLLDGRTTR